MNADFGFRAESRTLLDGVEVILAEFNIWKTFRNATIKIQREDKTGIIGII